MDEGLNMTFRKFFKLDEYGSTVGSELLGGATTFFTMAYIIIVNPKILESAGIPFGPSMVATILTAFFGTMAMGVYANRPFAVAPYMGENAFIAFTVVKVLGYSWQTALGAIFIGGVLFTLITICRIRSWLAKAIPESLKMAFAIGIGLFLTFIGLNETGIVAVGIPGAPVHVGNFHSMSILLAVAGFLLIGFFMIRKIKGAILLGILAITFLSFAIGTTALPERWVGMPPGLGPVFLQLDIRGAFTWGFFAVMLTILVMDFVDTVGTLIGLSHRAGLLDKDGNLPEIEKPMLCDALSTVVASLLGTSTAGAYIESATGIEAGGRTGLASVFTALLFLVGLFFYPFFTAIPAHAYGPALIVVGMLMMSPVDRLRFDDLTEFLPAFCVIVLMSFTYNIGIGMTAGFVLYPLLKAISGRIREVPAGLWILGLFSLLFFIFYPY
jgi:AGZA family xanthine/uracil permease-like MFS transporter